MRSSRSRISISQASYAAVLRWLSAGNVPTMPARQVSTTRSGFETRNIGAATAGIARRPWNWTGIGNVASGLAFEEDHFRGDARRQEQWTAARSARERNSFAGADRLLVLDNGDRAGPAGRSPVDLHRKARDLEPGRWKRVQVCE